MRKIIMMAALLMSMTLQAQEKSVVDKVATTVGNAVDSGKKAVSDAVTTVDTSSNFRKIYTDMKSGIEALASSLKVGTEHVYKVLVKQQVVYAIMWLIIDITVIVYAIILIRWTSKSLKTEQGKSTPEEIGVIIVFGWLVILIGIIIGIWHLDTMIGGLINPEYGAIKDIIDIVKTH